MRLDHKGYSDSWKKPEYISSISLTPSSSGVFQIHKGTQIPMAGVENKVDKNIK